MVDIQPENGYSRIANGILEALAKTCLPGRLNQVLMAVFRFSYGYHRKWAHFGKGALSKVTGLRRQALHKVLSEAEDRRILIVEREGHSCKIMFQKDWEQWINVTPTDYVSKVTPMGDVQNINSSNNYNNNSNVTPTDDKANVTPTGSERNPYGLRNVTPTGDVYTRKIKDNKKERAADLKKGSPPTSYESGDNLEIWNACEECANWIRNKCKEGREADVYEDEHRRFCGQFQVKL